MGTFTWFNGKKYIGNWKDCKKEGHGILYYRNGNKYDGDFKKGHKHGIGTFYFENGDFYKSSWKESQPSIDGTYNLKNGYTSRETIISVTYTTGGHLILEKKKGVEKM